MEYQDREREVRPVELECYAEHMERAGRDLCIFGLLTGAYVSFGQPDLPGEVLQTGLLFVAIGPLIYLATLLIGFRLRGKARRLA
ncbi:MAG: hypothetical protein V3V71_04930 [Roseateles sp.]|nr:hypothetical protein [Burkholderiaceae bacterium]